jgi:hypothetical protein
MARVWQLLVRADGDTRSAQKELRALQRSTKKFGRNMQSMGKTMSMAVTAPILAMGAVGVQELRETMVVTKKTEAVFESMGSTMRVTRKELDVLVKGLSKYSAIESDIIQNAANVGLSFSALAGNPALFKKTMKAAVDMSAALGIDVQQSVTMLGKAMQNGAKGAAALGKNGTLAKNEIAKLQEMAKAGVPLWKQQEYILAAVNKQYAGQGKNVDPIKAISVAFKDTAETLAVLLLPAIERFSTWMQKASAWVSGLNSSQRQMVGIMLLSAAAIGPVAYLIGSVVTVVGALIPLLGALAGVLGVSMAALLPMGVAAGIVAASIGILIYKEREKQREFLKSAQSAMSQVNALGSLADQQARLANAALGVKEASLAVEQAQVQYANAVRNGGRKSLEARQAALQLQRAKLQLKKATDDNRAAIDKERTATSLARVAITQQMGYLKAEAATRKQLAAAKERLRNADSRGEQQAAVREVSRLKSHLSKLQKSHSTSMKTIQKAYKNGLVTRLEILGAGLTIEKGVVKQKSEEIGAALSDGIRVGMLNGVGSLMQAARQAVIDARNAAKKEAGIHSPARTFADQIGKPIAEGMALGISSNTDVITSAVATSLHAGLDEINQVAFDQVLAKFEAAQAAVQKAKDTKSKKDDDRAATNLTRMRGQLNVARTALNAAKKVVREFENILTSGSLQSSWNAWQQAITMTTGTPDALRQNIAQMQNEYGKLEAYLRTNGKNLSAAVRQQIMDQMTSLLNGIDQATSDIAEAAKRAAEEAKQAILDVMSGINDQFDLLRAQAEYSAVLSGTDPAAELQRIAGEQYESLKAWYNANAGSLTTSEITGVLQELTRLYSQSQPSSSGSSVASIPAFASGGIITRPTMAIAGEAGPEAVVPLGASSRATQDRMRVMQQAGLMGGGVTINVAPGSGDPVAIAHQVARLLGSKRVAVGGMI